MKKLIQLFSLAVLGLIPSTVALGQEMKPLLAMDNQLNQVQAWLSTAIDKNSTYKSSDRVTESISQVKFEGCRMSYRILSEHGMEPLPSSATAPVRYYDTATTLSFDLSKMNLGGISLTPALARSNMLLLTLPSIQGQQNVSFTREDWNVKSNGKGSQFSAAMAIKADIADQVKAELLRTAVLCQMQK